MTFFISNTAEGKIIMERIRNSFPDLLDLNDAIKDLEELTKNQAINKFAKKLKEKQKKVLLKMPIDSNYKIEFAQGTIIDMMEEVVDKLLEARQ